MFYVLCDVYILIEYAICDDDLDWTERRGAFIVVR